MSLFALHLIFLFFFSGFAVAGPSAPDCSSTLNSTWEWSFNSLGQNACIVAAYMLSTCHKGSFTLQPLPPGDYYTGPSAAQGTDLCLCNTIAYSLLSACDGCQGSEWISWSDYAFNCTTILPPGSFPNPIPAGTSLQQWALVNVTNGTTWDANFAQAVGDTPELGPGTILDPDGPLSLPRLDPVRSLHRPIPQAPCPPKSVLLPRLTLDLQDTM
ncbi:hypothetical protein BGY98DRAFT_268207 [Russula aff. rugulosa BPL654]|nr:hypothetical protein BGY98DRAFT_268207 [Russula aff. rugulosa BPL654]